MGKEHLICFQDVAFLTSRASFSTLLRIEVEVKASTPPHVLGLWLGVSEGMLPVELEEKASTRLRTVVGGKRGHAPCRG